MVRLQYLAWGVAFILAGLSGPRMVCAQDAGPDTLTLINGAVVRGAVTAVTATGVVITAGSSERAFPWVALAPGSRFQYDTHYRVNLAGYLDGADPSTLTNQPDPAYNPMQPPRVVAELPEDSSIESTNLASLSWSGQATFQPSAVRGLESAAAGSAMFWSLRIGTGPEDVLVFAQEGGANPKLMMVRIGDSRMISEAPDNEETRAPSWSTSRRAFPVSFGSAAGEVAVSWILERDVPGARRWVEMQCFATINDERVDFTLQGEAVGWSSSKESLVPAFPFSAPEITLLVESGGNAAALTGGVNMGRWQVFPGSNTAARIRVEVLDAQGRTLVRDEVRPVSSDDPSGWSFRLPMEKIAAGTECIAKADIDLGSWLGRAETEYRFVLPDPYKQ